MSGGARPAASGAAERAPFDPVLLARMTGRMGDRRTIEAIGGALAAALAHPLADGMARSTGLSVSLDCGAVATGTLGELLQTMPADAVVAPAAVGGWCEHFHLVTGARFVAALVEGLLGGSADDGASADGGEADRALSEIEIDVSVVFFEQVVEAIAGCLEGMGQAVSSTGRPVPPAALAEEEGRDEHAARIELTVALGAVAAPLALVVPQSVLLRTRVSPPEVQPQPSADRGEWGRRLTQRLSNAQLSLQARVRLEARSLGQIAALRPGDVIPFAADKDVPVLLKANGKNLFWCELGRSGSRYMVRLARPHGGGEEWPA